MAFTQTLTWKSVVAGAIVSATKDYTGELQVSLDEVIAQNLTDEQIVIALDYSELAALIITADNDILIEVNDGAGIGGSLSLIAGVPYIWTSDTYDTIFITADVTGIFITTGATIGDTNLKLEAILDPTP